MRTAGILAMLGIGATPAADHRATWEQFPRVICRATGTQFCKITRCENYGHAPTAVFFIDFAAGTTKAAVSTKSFKIIDRHYIAMASPDFLETSTIVNDAEQTFAFGSPTTEELTSPTIKAVMTSAYNGEAMVMWLECNPT